MPTYMVAALTNGTNNMKQLYEFNGNAFAGGKQGELFRGKIETKLSCDNFFFNESKRSQVYTKRPGSRLY